jgi:hypothetical protein
MLSRTEMAWITCRRSTARAGELALPQDSISAVAQVAFHADGTP